MAMVHPKLLFFLALESAVAVDHFELNKLIDIRGRIVVVDRNQTFTMHTNILPLRCNRKNNLGTEILSCATKVLSIPQMSESDA